jgi:hypothetical protein
MTRNRTDIEKKGNWLRRRWWSEWGLTTTHVVSQLSPCHWTKQKSYQSDNLETVFTTQISDQSCSPLPDTLYHWNTHRSHLSRSSLSHTQVLWFHECPTRCVRGLVPPFRPTKTPFRPTKTRDFYFLKDWQRLPTQPPRFQHIPERAVVEDIKKLLDSKVIVSFIFKLSHHVRTKVSTGRFQQGLRQLAVR